MSNLQVTNSPRLFVTPSISQGLSNRLHSKYLKATAEQVLKDADWLTRAQPVKEGEPPAYGVGARWVQSHLENLTCAWILTRQAKYRKAAIRHLAGLMKWNNISCETRANTPPENLLPYCLSYGEQSMAIGMMYDQFRPDLTSDEQKVFFDVIDRFHLKQAINCLTAPPWWANKSWSNWNGVCSGGMGVMALAFYQDRPDAHPLIPFVEGSLGEYFKSYITNGGGCHEGTGYWNYGMNYAMRYVLSWESATGQKHPSLDIPEMAQSLMFPVDFTGLSFGDNDGWHPSAFYFLLARRLNQHSAACRAAAYLTERKSHNNVAKTHFSASGDLLYAADAIPADAEMKKRKTAHAKKKAPVATLYRGMEWASLADDDAFPSLRMSIRGGSAKVEGHGMIDLLSFRCRVNGELMITDQQEGGYMAPTFSRRGSDLYTRSPESKSTLFVEGLGCAKDATCDKTEIVHGKGLSGVRIDATHNYLPKMPAQFIGRLFLFVDNAYWLVIDHVVGKDVVSNMGIESRFHTLAKSRQSKNHVALSSGKERLQMTFGALQPGVLQQSRGMPASPKIPQTTIFRWIGQERVVDNLHVVALTPGTNRPGLNLSKTSNGGYQIKLKLPRGRSRMINLRSELTLA